MIHSFNYLISTKYIIQLFRMHRNRNNILVLFKVQKFSIIAFQKIKKSIIYIIFYRRFNYQVV